MRVVVTVPWGERLGGAETMLQGLLDVGADDQHELELVFLEPGPWARELEQRGFGVTVIHAGRLRQLHLWGTAVLRLARLLRARKPDLLLNWSAKTQLYGAPAALLAGMGGRVVWWQHAIPTRSSSWVDRAATLLPATAIGCTSHTAASAQERLRPRRRTLVVAAGSAPPDASADAAPLELPRGVPIVGLVGRLQPWKGQDRLLRAQAILRGRGHRMHTVIVGGDSYGLSPEYAASLEPLVLQLGLEGAVTMTGEVPDAGPYIAQMDILVNASDVEPFGIVILEGMARGAAIVAVNSGGPSEFVESGVTGMLASTAEPDALADALEPLLLSASLRERIGQAGHARYVERYTTAAMRGRFFASLEQLVDSKRD
ncbi:MAG TPA: glycosyltransferase [Solirubrobacteraceae bacterium]|jgi:glycosyltransferase involved in cell wall biosynthesis|nr:glycosyltransferase [Solirubrobacteraceae bacterium]